MPSTLPLRRSTSPIAAPLDTVADVETPEHIRFHFQVAGPARRGLAYIVDFILRALVLMVFVILAGALGLFGAIDLSNSDTLMLGLSAGMLSVVVFVLEWGYFTLFEALWDGRTPGKRLLGLRVVKEGGQPLSFADSLIRNLVRGADFAPWAYALGVLVMSVDGRFRRLGDMAAGTLVINERWGNVAKPLPIDPPPSPEELEWVRARPPLSRAELEAIESFLRRLGSIPMAREVELAEMIAPMFAARLGVQYHDPVRFLAILYVRARG